MNVTLDGLIQRCKDLVEEEDQEFVEEFVGKKDPSILHFLLASGDQVIRGCSSDGQLHSIDSIASHRMKQCAYVEASAHCAVWSATAPYALVFALLPVLHQ